MPDKKDKDIKVSVTYQHENTIIGAEVTDASTIMPPKMAGYKIDELNKIYNERDYAKKSFFGEQELSQIYKDNGNSGQAAYNSLVDYLKANRDNPDVIRKTAQSLAMFGKTFYDNSQNRSGVGNSPAETLEAWLNAPNGSTIKGNICGVIHGVVASALKDADIPATLIAGKGAKGSEHIALIYKNTDGKYVFNDYGKSIELKSNSVLEAIDEAQAGSNDFDIVGYYTLENGGDVSFQKFAYERENAYGETIDKTAYNKDLPQAPDIADKSGIQTNVTFADSGNIKLSSELTTLHNTQKSQSQTIIGFEARKTNNSTLFNSSAYSVGGKYQHDVIKNNGWYHKTNTTLSYMTGKIGGQHFHNALSENEIDARMCADINQDLVNAGFPDKATFTPRKYPAQETFNSYSRVNNITASVQHFTGKENKIINSENITVINTAQAGVIAGVTTSANNLSINGDVRFILEDGIKTNIAISPELSSTALISAGAMGDLKISHLGFPVGLQPAFCAKGAIGADYHNKNFKAETNIGGYRYNTASTTDTGLSAALSANYKLSKNLSFKGSLFVQKEKQRLNMDLFNEKIVDKTTIGASISADIKKNTVGINAAIQKDKINPSKNTTSVTLNYTLHF